MVNKYYQKHEEIASKRSTQKILKSFKGRERKKAKNVPRLIPKSF